ncbi:16S rRNA m(5)C-967 methyltransferase [Orbus hercynius]|uniref:16S rRNA (cytosine(967)-C(5))-methyltransferase n=1 Tax=Orbus hercynius TaxID=593135 RepID=A0A495REQ1_9GAMM|nr:16S rRNA (cytosine(967)-C(5))-methyltransferase RsmB [Orbus hercynius]RKS85967.1 16S rRNA m(5)C-967 methyltransferase [Orbus hercynius]
MTSSNKPQSERYNLRALCAQAILEVLEHGASLSQPLNSYANKVNDKDRALMQEICFGIMRMLPELEFYVQNLMDKVFTGKNRVVHYLLLVGLYQILYTRIPEHAAASETVNGVVVLKKQQLKGVVNGVLRSFLRQKTELNEQFKQQGNTSLHPNWLLTRIKHAYPDSWQTIINANNQRPPMWIRVNKQHDCVKEYQQKLHTKGIDTLTDNNLDCALRVVLPVPVNQLPDFELGAATVQDLSAQHAAYLLAPQDHETILDLCAAPGGKTTHILELAPQAQVLAVDIDSERVKRIHQNLKRLKLRAEVKIGDGLTPEQWCENQQFDRILLDAPCSATGVIRRHPDIKWLRRDSDIAELAKLQYQILVNIWPYLKSGGILVYATCSILPDENSAQILRFLADHDNAKQVGEMQQYLPDENGGDGFFYTKLQKS